MPSEFHQCDTVKFIVDIPEFKSDDYFLEYRLANSEGKAIEVVSIPDADGCHLVEIESERTKKLSGEYVYQATISDGNVRFVFDTGIVHVLPSIDVGGFVNPRSHAEQTLVMIEKALEGKMTKDVAEYAINGRSLKRYSIESLLMKRDKYRREVNSEKRANKLRNGRKINQIRVRF